jgi:hypothetical protein
VQDRSFQSSKPVFAKGCRIFRLTVSPRINCHGVQSTLALVSKPIRFEEFGLTKQHIWLVFLSSRLSAVFSVAF